MSLNLPRFEYFDYIVDRRDPRPPHHAEPPMVRKPRRRRRWLVLG